MLFQCSNPFSPQSPSTFSIFKSRIVSIFATSNGLLSLRRMATTGRPSDSHVRSAGFLQIRFNPAGRFYVEVERKLLVQRDRINLSSAAPGLQTTRLTPLPDCHHAGSRMDTRRKVPRPQSHHSGQVRHHPWHQQLHRHHFVGFGSIRTDRILPRCMPHRKSTFPPIREEASTSVDISTPSASKPLGSHSSRIALLICGMVKPPKGNPVPQQFDDLEKLALRLVQSAGKASH
nr:hypothetical protein Iba_chr07dCG5670 [Ipomoea batatas]